MAYTALYRKFRPLNFKDMVGQDHITKTLKNQIMADRVGHAYLFNGGRGTGKTTTAKILARAVNCLNPQDGEPCNECEICKEILSGSLTDVVEMDAASNNSVEDIRSIREEVNFLPTKAKYRVYIIDEVHMLSTGAFNALLKTLEEPPEHVKFFLATTEPQKLPATILSRCQRFDYKRISNEDVVKRLKIICEESKINITEGALNIIATLSEGAMRDAISILERCSQEEKELIEEKDVKELVGIPSLEHIGILTRAVLDKDEIKALEISDEVINQGKDIYNFLWELIKYVKDILVYKVSNKADLYSEEEIKKIKDLSEKASKDDLLNIIYKLSDLENDIKYSSQKVIMFETGIIKLCEKVGNILSSKGDSILENRISQIEEQLKNLKLGNNTKKEEEIPQIIPEEKPDFNVISNLKKAEPPIIKEEKKEIGGEGEMKQVWKEVLEALKKAGKLRLYTCLASTSVVKNGDMILEIKFPNGMTNFNKQILDDPTNRNDLIKIIADVTGDQMYIKYGNDKKEQAKINNNSSNPLDGLGIDVNIID